MDSSLLRHLLYFATVARAGSFARAADRLGLSQPPLSQQILSLEARLGSPLLNRSRSGTTPTAFGRSLLPQIEAVLAETERLETLVADLCAGKVSRLTIGAIGSAVQESLPDLITQARAYYPDLALDLLEMDSADQVTALRMNQIDIAFLRADQLGPDIAVTPVHRAPLCLAVPEKHPLARDTGIDWKDLDDAALVQCRRDVSPAFHDALSAASKAGGIAMRSVKEVGSISSQFAMVACGMGVAIVPNGGMSMPVKGVHLTPLLPRQAITTLAIAIRINDQHNTIGKMRDMWVRALDPT